MFKRTHSVKGEFYFQFGFAANEQVYNEKVYLFFSASAAVSVLQIKYSFVKPKHSNHYISYVK